MGFDPARIRADFPLLARTLRGKPLVYLDNAATTQKPRAVLDALRDFYEKHNANVNRGVHTLSEEATALMEESREKTARLIGAPKPHTVIFTRNTTESINLVARAWGDKNLKKGEEILLTELEHHSNLVPWQMLCQRTGALLRSVPMEADGTLSVAKARKLLSPKTRLFSFTAASNALGSLSPVKELVESAHRAGALALVDAAQWTPHRATDVVEWDCDFLAFSAHKMFGPTGVGVLWGKEELLESMDPFLGGGDMISQVWPERFTCNALPHKFEAGTPNVADIAAFGAAVDYLQGLGLEALRRHEEVLVRRTLEVLRADDRVKVFGPADGVPRGGVVSFSLGDVHPHDAGQLFDAEGVELRVGHHCCQPLMRKLKVPGTVRVSFYAYNTLEEVEAFARALRKAGEFFKIPAKVNG